MTTVNIDIEKLNTAITKLTDLAARIDGQRARASTGTPVSVPSLGDSELGKKSLWLRDQLPELQTRHDLAVLLDTGDTGHASYDIAYDNLTNTKDLLGQQLASALNNVDAETSAEDLDELNSILVRQQNDPDVMGALFETLGPDGTVGVIGSLTTWMNFVGPDEVERLRTLAENMRSGLATASNSPAWQNRPDPYGSSLTYAQIFADDMVRYSVAPLLTTEEQDAFAQAYPNVGMHGASVLTFLMQEHGYSGDFLVSAASTLDQFEQQSEDSMFGPATNWYSHNGMSSLIDSGQMGAYDDPMAAIMQNFAANPDDGLTFFTEDRQLFYFDKRDWTHDGYESIAMAADSIATDSDNLANNPEATTRLASAFVDYIADGEGFNPEDAEAASPYVADLLKFYMPAVDQALRNGEMEGQPNSEPFELNYFGTFEHYPEFYRGDLDSIMQVAMGTEDGMTSIAEGVGAFQQTQINNAAVVFGLDPDDPSTQTQLRDVLERTAALQGFTEYSVGQVEIDAAKDRDAQRQVFIDLVSDAAGLVPLPGADQVGDLTSKLVKFGFSQAVDLGTDAAGEAFASEAAGVTDNAEKRAEDSTNRIKVNAFIALVEAGVIPQEEVSELWFEDGSLIGLGDIPAEDMSRYTQSAMNGVTSVATHMDLETSYRDSFLSYYAPAGG